MLSPAVLIGKILSKSREEQVYEFR